LISLKTCVGGIAQDLPKEQVAQLWERVQGAKALLREVDGALKAGALAYMQGHSLDVLMLSETSWLTIQNKTTDRQAAPAVLLGAMIDACHGSAEAIGACLSSGAFKPAATKKCLLKGGGTPERVKELIWKEVRPEVVLVENDEEDQKFLKRGK